TRRGVRGWRSLSATRGFFAMLSWRTMTGTPPDTPTRRVTTATSAICTRPSHGLPLSSWSRAPKQTLDARRPYLNWRWTRPEYRTFSSADLDRRPSTRPRAAAFSARNDNLLPAFQREVDT